MRALLQGAALGCGSAAPAPSAPSAPPPAAPCPPAAAPAAAMLDEAAVKAKSHAFLEAIDRTDVAAATAELSPSFLRVDPARYYDTKWLVASLESRKGATRTRTYKDERIELAPNLAVFMGESIEHVPATATHPAAEIDRWHTLTWAYDGSAWKLAQWTSRDGGIDAEREQWNSTLRRQVGFKITVGGGRARGAGGGGPGAARDVSGGQGRNSVWLATQGWKVTELDLSDVGLELA